jgi:hypothetical protein
VEDIEFLVTFVAGNSNFFFEKLGSEGKISWAVNVFREIQMFHHAKI